MLLALAPARKGHPLEDIPYHVQRWVELIQHVAEPDFELTIEEAAPILHTFKRLLDAGYEFDAMLVALMRVLQRQCFYTDDDTDSDISVDDG